MSKSHHLASLAHYAEQARLNERAGFHRAAKHLHQHGTIVEDRCREAGATDREIRDACKPQPPHPHTRGKGWRAAIADGDHIA